MAFSYWSIQGSGYQTVYYGLFVLLLGVPVYVWLKRGQGRYGDTAAVIPAARAPREERAPETPAPPKRLSRGLGTNRVGGPRKRDSHRHQD
jgi:basic amino acid/polyamine antiporter, APA family